MQNENKDLVDINSLVVSEVIKNESEGSQKIKIENKKDWKMRENHFLTSLQKKNRL